MAVWKGQYLSRVQKVFLLSFTYSDRLLSAQVVLGDLGRPTRWTRIIECRNHRSTVTALKHELAARLIQELSHCLDHRKGERACDTL